MTGILHHAIKRDGSFIVDLIIWHLDNGLYRVVERNKAPPFKESIRGEFFEEKQALEMYENVKKEKGYCEES